jgi:hypothetical protein
MCDCCPRYASQTYCDDHDIRRAAAWAQIDARLADRFLDDMLLAKELHAAPGAVRRFVKVRRMLLELAGQPSLPDDQLHVVDQLLGLDEVHAVAYQRVAERVSYELAAGFDVTVLPRIEANPDPAFDLYPQIPTVEGSYCCPGWFQ